MELVSWLEKQITWDGRWCSGWSADRAAREVEAKRLLFALHRDCADQCYVVRVLALPYADQAGYREEWRP